MMFRRRVSKDVMMIALAISDGGHEFCTTHSPTESLRQQMLGNGCIAICNFEWLIAVHPLPTLGCHPL